MAQYKRRDDHIVSKPRQEISINIYDPDIGYEIGEVNKVRDIEKIIVPKHLDDVRLKSLSNAENFSIPSLYMLDSSNMIQVKSPSNVVRGLGACQRTTKLLERKNEIIREIRMNPPPPPPPRQIVPIPNEIFLQGQTRSSNNMPIKKLNGRSHPWDIPPRTNAILFGN